MTDDFETLFRNAIIGDESDRHRFAEHCLSTRRYLLALEWYRRLAAAGDVEAQFTAASLYLEGRGCPVPDPEKAKALLTAAAKAGHAEAAAKLAALVPSAAPALPAEDKPQQLSFRDVAFKPSKDGALVCEVIPFDHEEELQAANDPAPPANPSQDYDCGLYENMPLSILEPQSGPDPYAALQAMIGLSAIKDRIATVCDQALFHARRQEAGFATAAAANHFVFTGNPGTGKTQVARTIGRLLLDSGLLSRGHVVEVDRTDLIAGWVGHTALKTRAVLQQAKGGVLFIDEAYALADDGPDGFGSEAIATLMKRLEDEREDLVVIMAGYPREMEALLSSNPGLRSRMRHHIHFPDFSGAELAAIFEKFCADQGYVLHPDTKPLITALFAAARQRPTLINGNARFVRNIFEATTDKMARRVIRQNQQDLATIYATDIPAFSEIAPPRTQKSLL